MTAVRVLTAAALAVALLSAVLPAVDAAREDRADSLVRGELDRLERAARSLETDDVVGKGVPGARRTVELSIPRASWAAAPVAYVAVGGVPVVEAGSKTGTGAAPPASDDAAEAVVAYRLRDGTPRTVRVDDPRLRTPDGPVVLGPGRHRLVLSLTRVRGDGRPRTAVVVRRG